MSLFGGVTLPGIPDLENVARLDRLPIPMIRRMQRVGIAIDIPYLQDLGGQLRSEMTSLEKEISSHVPADALAMFTARADQVEEVEGDALINAASADQIRTLLFQILGVGRGKKLSLTDSGKVSTGKKTLEMCRGDHPVVGKILAFRQRAKLLTTYVTALPKLAKFHPRGECCPVCELPHDAETWRVHSTFPTTRAETGRLASRNPNIQNIPLRSKLGGAVRAGFVASPGKRLVSVDFSQIELRDAAHISNCRSMIEVYEKNGDIHLDTTLKCFPRIDPKDAKKPQYRVPAKTGNFAIIYGISYKAFYAQLQYTFSSLYAEGQLTEADYREVSGAWDEEECDKFIQTWFATKPEVREYLDLQEYRARRYGIVWDGFGRVRRVSEVRSCHQWKQSEGVRQAGNMPIQSLSAGQTKLAMGELDRDFEMMRDMEIDVQPLVPVHDQVIAEVDEGAAEEVGAWTSRVFDGVMGDYPFRVPIKSDCEITERWVKE